LYLIIQRYVLNTLRIDGLCLTLEINLTQTLANYQPAYQRSSLDNNI